MELQQDLLIVDGLQNDHRIFWMLFESLHAWCNPSAIWGIAIMQFWKCPRIARFCAVALVLPDCWSNFQNWMDCARIGGLSRDSLELHSPSSILVIVEDWISIARVRSRMRSNRWRIIRAAWDRVLIFGSGFNRRAICLNCNRIANILICNWVDCKRRDHRLHQDCDNPGERVFWIVGPREDCKGPQASVWTYPRVRAQTWRSAVRLGLIANHSWNPQFCMDCPSIGQIEPRLHCSYSWCSSVTFHSIALGLPPFVQSRCNRDW